MNHYTFPSRVAAVCLSFTCLLPMFQSAQAAVHTQPVQVAITADNTATVVTTADQTILVLPRFKYITRISSSLSISNSGYANCTGGFTLYDEYPGNITITLQQFSDGRWTDIKEWSEDYTATDTGAHLFNKGYYVDSGYRYRLVTVVTITDADGTVIENEFCDSPVSEY